MVIAQSAFRRSLPYRQFIPIMPPFSLAIVDANMLSAIGLQQILKRLVPMADIRLYSSFDALVQAGAADVKHCFVSSRVYFEHASFFREHHTRTIVMVAGDMHINGVMTLNVCQSEQQLVKSILSLHRMGHPTPHPAVADYMAHESMSPSHAEETVASAPLLLSAREIEVTRLLVKGYINKEVADALNISTTTVITHRKNIMEKLHARSLADLIIYMVMNGLIDLGEL